MVWGSCQRRIVSDFDHYSGTISSYIAKTITCDFCFFTKLKQSAKEEEEAGKRVEQMVSLLFQVHLCCLLLSERCKVLKPNRVAASVCFIRNISPRGVIFHYLIFLIVCFPWHIIWEESHPSIPFEAQSMQQFVFLLDFLCILSAGFGFFWKFDTSLLVFFTKGNIFLIVLSDF